MATVTTTATALPVPLPEGLVAAAAGLSASRSSDATAAVAPEAAAGENRVHEENERVAENATSGVADCTDAAKSPAPTGHDRYLLDDVGRLVGLFGNRDGGGGVAWDASKIVKKDVDTGAPGGAATYTNILTSSECKWLQRFCDEQGEEFVLQVRNSYVNKMYQQAFSFWLLGSVHSSFFIGVLHLDLNCLQ